jgi:hypothetical protein
VDTSSLGFFSGCGPLNCSGWKTDGCKIEVVVSLVFDCLQAFNKVKAKTVRAMNCFMFVKFGANVI